MRRERLEVALAAVTASHRGDARPDAELLARFLTDRDQAAFEALLVRHTPAVRAACRSWLRSAADIDDAAQATFLFLVRRAGSIRNRAALGCWLYRVAANVARRLKRRTAHAPAPDDLTAPEPGPDGELCDLLAEEVARLPEKYRLPVQLCYWAGLTTAEAAHRLGVPKGTVLTRLAWARERLRGRLTRLGLAPASLSALAVRAAPAVSRQWVSLTAHAAKVMLSGESPARAGVSERTVFLTEGAVRAMIGQRIKFLVLAVLLAAGVAGFGLGKWAEGSDNRKPLFEPSEPKAAARPASAAEGKKAAEPPAEAEDIAEQPAAKGARADEGRIGRRREVVIRLPVGSFVKEVDVEPYGSGRLTWTYEEDRVVGLIEGSVMGVEFEIATEAEFSLSSTGMIYGIITGFHLNHLKLPAGEKFEELKPFVGLWPVVEPVVNDVMLDMPFSYRFRVQGDRLVISDFRMLLSGPNPFGKVGALMGAGGGDGGLLSIAMGFQAVGTAVEGTYTAGDGKEKPAPMKRSPIKKVRKAEPKPATVKVPATSH